MKQVAPNQLSIESPELYEHGIYIESFLEYINYESQIKDGTQSIKLLEDVNIEFKNVCFKYSDTDMEVLKNINLTIKSGEKIALVGRNGSGKSTIVKLLTRLYDPTGGTIYLQGLPYGNYKISEIRNYFGTLFQDFQIFSISLMENVLMREIDVEIDDIKKVKEALEFSGLSKKISSLKDGIFTEISREFDNEGAIFSGGESQSIAIARVFLKNSKAIILDEPSSSLDPISEKELFNKMMELTADKTVIFVSHRLSNITHVDRILYIEDGEIKETGTHYELMQMDGSYAKMYKTQADKYKADYSVES